MSQDEDRRKLERAAKKGDESAKKKLEAMERRTLSGHDADYLLRYLALNEEVTMADSQGNNHANPTSFSTYRGESRKRPVSEVLKDFEALNKEFEDKVSSQSVLKKRLIVLDAFREGIEVASWSSSTVDCNANGSHGDDRHIYQYASRNGKESGLPWRGPLRESYDEQKGWAEKYPTEVELDRYFSPEDRDGVQS